MSKKSFITWLNIELSKKRMTKKTLVEKMHELGCTVSYSTLICQFNGFIKLKEENRELVYSILNFKRKE